MIRILDKNICALIVKRFFRRSKDIPNSQFLSGKIARLGMKQYPLVFLLSCTGHPLLSRRRKSPSSSRRRAGEVWRTRGLCSPLVVLNKLCLLPPSAENLCFLFDSLSLGLDHCFYLCKHKAAYFKGLSQHSSRCKAQQLDINAAWHHNHLGPFFPP